MEAFTVLAAVSTIAKTAESAWIVADTLHCFINDARNVTQTVRDLHLDVEKLRDSCNLARDQLEELAKAERSSGGPTNVDDTHLWKCFDDQTKDCDKTLDKLSQSIGSEGAIRRNVLKQAWRQVQLNMSTSEIQSARARVRSHTDSLQIILLTINIKVSNLAPRRANQELITKIDALTSMVNMFASRQTTEELASSTTLPPDPKHEKELIDCAQKVVQSGRTMYEESVADGSIAETVVLFKAEVDKINDWLRHLDMSSEASSEGTEVGDAAATSVDESNPTSDNIVTPATSIPESDLRDEMTIEVVTTCLQMGTDAFESSDYKDADELLKEGLKILEELSMSQRGTICDLWALKYHLAVCAFHIASPDEAKTVLLSVISGGTISDIRRLKVYNSSHLLAQTYVRLGKFEEARQSCEQALSGRRSSLGKTHELCKESMALLVRILELKGEVTRAKVYKHMIGQNDRAHYEQLYANLAPVCIMQKNAAADARPKEDVPESSSNSGEEDKPDAQRFQELERRLAASLKGIDEMQQQISKSLEREQKIAHQCKTALEERQNNHVKEIKQLENDHSAHMGSHKKSYDEKLRDRDKRIAEGHQKFENARRAWKSELEDVRNDFKKRLCLEAAKSKEEFGRRENMHNCKMEETCMKHISEMRVLEEHFGKELSNRDSKIEELTKTLERERKVNNKDSQA